MEEKSVVRENMMKDKNYRPYCGADKCIGHWPRVDKDFKCPSCGFQGEYEETFWKRYKDKWRNK